MRFSDPDVPLAESRFISFYLRAASTKHRYKRELYGVFEYIGDLGGLYSMISLLAFYLTASIVERLYQAAVISSTYAVQHYDKDVSQYYASRSFKEKLTSESTSNDDDDDEKEGHKAAATFYEDEAAQVGGVNIVEEGKDRFDMSDNFLKPVNITQSKTLNFKQRTKESQLRGKFARASTHKKRSSLANDDDHIERGNINYRK